MDNDNSSGIAAFTSGLNRAASDFRSGLDVLYSGNPENPGLVDNLLGVARAQGAIESLPEIWDQNRVSARTGARIEYAIGRFPGDEERQWQYVKDKETPKKKKPAENGDTKRKSGGRWKKPRTPGGRR